MLQPKRTKFRKAHKGRIHGTAKGGTEYALAVVMEATKFTGRGELLMLVDQEASAKLLLG